MPADSEKKLACLVCRHRKVACDRRRPKCGLCDKNDFDCQYKAREHRPGLRAGYVSQLEKRVEHLERRMDEVVGELWQERSQKIGPSRSATRLPDDGALSMELHTSPQLEYDSTEHRNITRPEDVQLDQNTPCTGVASPSQAANPLDNELQDLWLQRYHPWFPILHHTSMRAAFSGTVPDRSLVRKAITAVTIWDIPGLSTDYKLAQSGSLSQEVVLKAMGSSNFDSLQGLLILAMLAWGEGKWSQCGNLIALCKRMSQQLDISSIAGVNRSKSRRPPRNSVEAVSTIAGVDKEEQIRVFWMIEMLDSIFALGSADSFSAPTVPPTANFPCSDTIWALQEPFREGIPFQHLGYSSGFSMCISLCTIELGALHRFQQTVCENNEMAGGLEWQSTAQKIDERLTIWREEFVAAVFRLINTEFPQDAHAHAEMEPFIVLTNCVLNMAVITLLQSQTSFPPGFNTESQPWPYANYRCMYACENMAAKIRRMQDDQLKTCSPCLILPVFVAARFYIVHTKCLHADVSVNLHSLAYSLHICSHRWPLARVFESVIRTAVAEHRTPVLESVLPAEFYDLRYSVIEISPILQNWVDNAASPFL